jgi:hypothetical protein
MTKEESEKIGRLIATVDGLGGSVNTLEDTVVETRDYARDAKAGVEDLKERTTTLELRITPLTGLSDRVDKLEWWKRWGLRGVIGASILLGGFVVNSTAATERLNADVRVNTTNAAKADKAAKEALRAYEARQAKTLAKLHKALERLPSQTASQVQQQDKGQPHDPSFASWWMELTPREKQRLRRALPDRAP